MVQFDSIMKEVKSNFQLVDSINAPDLTVDKWRIFTGSVDYYPPLIIVTLPVMMLQLYQAVL